MPTAISPIRERILSLPIAEGERLNALRHLDSAEALAEAVFALVALFVRLLRAKSPRPLRPAL